MTQRTLVPIFAVAALALALSGCGRNDPDKLVAAAEGYLAKNEVPAAVIELKNALNQSPDNARARFLLGKTYLETGDVAGAATELRKAIALKYAPDDAYPLLARALAAQRVPQGEIAALADAPVTTPRAKAEIAGAMAAAYLQANEIAQAQTAVDRALSLDPALVSAQVTRARLLAVRNELPAALAAANAVLEKSPGTLDAMLLKAEVESIMGRANDARATVESMIKAAPNHIIARYMLVTLLVRAQQIDQAATEVDAMRKIAPNDPRTNYSAGLVAFARNDYPAALVAVQSALKVAPNFAPALSLSALVDIQRGSYGAAEQSLRNVLAQVPNDVPARVALAQVMLQTGDVGKARSTLAPLLDQPQVDVATLRMAAAVETAANRRDVAAQLTDRANVLEANSTGGRVRLAQLKLAKGDVQAVSELQSIAATEPTKTEADAALVEGFLRSRDYDKALAAADAMIKKQPKAPGGYNVKGTVYAARGDMKNARDMYEKALAQDPKFISALLNLASTDAVEHKFADARKRYDQILAVDPKSERALLGIAQLGITTNDTPANVAAAIQRAIDANPRSPSARLALMSYYLRVKDYRAAVTAGQAAAAAVPDSPPILDALGTAQQAAGDRGPAIETFSRWAKLQPNNPAPQIRIGAVQMAQKNYDAAAGAFAAVIAMTPNNPQAWLGLASSYIEADKVSVGLLEALRLQKDTRTRLAGYVLEGELQAHQKRLPEAIAAYRAALQREPVPQAAIRLHMLLTASAKPDEANSVLQKYLKDHPKDVLVRNYLGQQAIARGDYKEASVQYRAAVATEPDNLTILNNLAWSLSEMKDPKALEYAAHAYALAPGNPSVANTYGWVLVQKGDLTQGIAALRRAVALSPEDAEYRVYLAKALIQSGDKAGARKELDVAAKSDNQKARGQAEQLIKTL